MESLRLSFDDVEADRFADLGGMTICYRDYGDPEAPVLVMLIGISLDLTAWPPAMVEGFVEAGFRVILMDNRDSGRSTRLPWPPPPKWRLAAGRPDPSGYDLGDMAGDVVGLLDALEIPAAHLLGMSLGGMIAQTVAARWPDRTLTLTSIFSSTGARKVGQPSLAVMIHMARPIPRARDKYAAGRLTYLELVGSPSHGYDADLEYRYALRAWDRSQGDVSDGSIRQVNAIMLSGDRTAELSRIQAPTLVLHGDADVVVHPSGGDATAFAIPRARRHTIVGMGHHFAPGLIDEVVELVVEHAGVSRPG